MTVRKWLICYSVTLLILLCVCIGVVYYTDPFFHYHVPHTETFFYVLNNERSQNDGILKHFDYDAIVAGNSMAQNFKTTEADALFDVHSIKLTYEGGTFRELNDALTLAFDSHPGKIKTVIRALDFARFFEDKDAMREDLGEYPTYLYNNNPFDDVYYLLNRDVVFGRCVPMIANALHGEETGITPFDLHGYWMPGFVGHFGKNELLAGRTWFNPPEQIRSFSEEERERITANVRQNIIVLCEAHPETDFYYFITPYSAAWWGEQWENGNVDVYIEGELVAISMIVECENIRLFSYNCFTDITGDLDNYKDPAHYGEWINSQILHYMHDDVGRLTKDNYLAYSEEEKKIYRGFDYNALFSQEDKEDRPSDYSW